MRKNEDVAVTMSSTEGKSVAILTSDVCPDVYVNVVQYSCGWCFFSNHLRPSLHDALS